MRSSTKREHDDDARDTRGARHALTLQRIGAIVAFALVLGLASCARRDTEAHMARAREFAARSEHRAAMIELKNVLAHDPSNAEARLMLASAELELGDAAGAEKELRRAEELGVSPDTVRIPRARALIEVGEAERALELLDPGTVSEPAARAEVHALSGDAHRALEKRDEARADYGEALALDARSLTGLLGLAQLELAQGALDEAERRFDEAVETHPDAAAAQSGRARFLVEQRRFEEAQSAFERALARMPTGLSRARMEALAGLAEAQLGRGERAAARATVEQLADLAGPHPLTQFLRARLAFDAKDFDEAGPYLDEVLAKAPDYQPAKLLQGAVNLARGNYGQAEMHLKSVVAAEPDNVQARKMLAAARLGLQQPRDALNTLRPALDPTDGSMLAMLGQASVRVGDYEAGLDYLRRSLIADPDNLAVELELAAGYLAAGRVDEAIEALRSVPAHSDADTLRRELLLVLALARKQNWDGARASAEALAARFPDQAMTHNLSGSVELAAGSFDAARAQFERASALQPDSVTAVLNLARVDHAEGAPDAAYARLAAFLERVPDNLLALLALAELDERRGSVERSIEHLRLASTAHPDAMQPRVALARVLTMIGDYEGALAPAQEAVQLKPDSAAAPTALGLAQLGLGRREEALVSFRKAVALLPRSADAQFNIARALHGLGRRVQARAALERALALDSGHVGAGTLLARVALEGGRPEEALAIAQRLDSAHPDGAAALTLRGDVYVARAQYAEAAQDYAAALARAPERSIAVRLYQARLSAGATNALDALTEWLAAHPDDVSARLTLGQALQDAGRSTAAIAEYERVIAAEPDSAVALNNLAWAYAERGDARALAIAHRAHAAAPDSGEVIDTLGWLLVEHDELQEAVPLLREAVERAPDVAEIRYHLAVALARSGTVAEARTLLQALVGSSTEFQSKAQARELLDEL